MRKVFIDGAEGTTGLRLSDRLAARSDIELLLIDPDLRKDTDERLRLMKAADLSLLCLPDAGAEEIVKIIDEAAARGGEDSSYAGIRLIDCSTVHRTAASWTYGLPEIMPEDTPWAELKRVSNPGCHATGFIMTVRPLIEAGLISPGITRSVHSLTGYSGGGKAMIAEYVNKAAREASPLDLLTAPRQYGLAQVHKHLPEMLEYSLAAASPIFAPIVGDYYCGMLVSVPLTEDEETARLDKQEVYEALAGYYEGKSLVRVYEPGSDPEGGLLSATALADRDDIEFFIFGADGTEKEPARITVISRYDNLGKGASGAAVQNMNLMLGFPETAGLTISG